MAKSGVWHRGTVMRKLLLLLLTLVVLFALDVVGSYAVSASSTSSLAEGRVCRDPRRAEPCPGGGDDCEMHLVHQVFLPIAPAGVNDVSLDLC